MIYYHWTAMGCVLVKCDPAHIVQFVSAGTDLDGLVWTPRFSHAKLFASYEHRNTFTDRLFLERPLALYPRGDDTSAMFEFLGSLDKKILNFVEELDDRRVSVPPTHRILEL